MRVSLLSLLIVLVVGLGSFLFSLNARAEAAPDWSLTNLDGKAIKLSDFKGKIVIINFWATWCPPCRAEIPDFIDVAKEYQGKGVVIVGFSVDSAQPSEVAAFAKKMGINYSIVMSTDALAQSYGATDAIPVTCVVAPDGSIVDQKVGMVSKDYLEGQIKKLLPSVTAP